MEWMYHLKTSKKLQLMEMLLQQFLGTAAADTLVGDAGADTITGRAGADTLTGGSRSDTFVFIQVIQG